MDQFPHLKFSQKIIGKPRLFGGGEESEITEANKKDRKGHRDILIGKTDAIKSDWDADFVDRDSEGCAPIDKDVIPLFFRINPQLVNDPKFDLAGIGIEIISEEEDGFIIGASLDNLNALRDKIEGFVKSKYTTGRIADLWEIIEGNRNEWKPKHILSEDLFSKWQDISDESIYKVEVGIAFNKPLGAIPDSSKRGGVRRLEKYKKKLVELEDLLFERQEHFEKFIRSYGRPLGSFIDLEDSFSCVVEITGKGLKDLVVNYQFVFEVNEVEEIAGTEGNEIESETMEIDILPPDDNDPIVGLIDSGVMEGHRYLRLAMDNNKSKSYVLNDDSTSDKVSGGGHGTKVAGAILFPMGVSNIQTGYKLPCIIRNLRILNDENKLVSHYPAKLIEDIVEENEDCEIFNLSVTSRAPYRTKHMSSWAALLDTLIHQKNILFIIASGNLNRENIKGYLLSGQYPDYLHQPFCRLANPAQSCFSLTVGSVNHSAFEDSAWKSIGGEGDISPFSRIGTGIWETIKPDVVEYGGGLVSSKQIPIIIKEHKETSTELIRSTLNGGSAKAKDDVGTSFSAPKVTHIVAQLKKIYLNENVNLLRALVVQGARLPNSHFSLPSKESLQYFGYGIPLMERVTKNTDHRITFYNTGSIKCEEAHVYSLQIPEDLGRPENDYDILLEVTLAYTAKVRRTRQKINSYLGTWLDWSTSKMDERFDDFKSFTLKEIEGTQTTYDSEARRRLKSFPWKINNRTNSGMVQNLSRSSSTLQKDWCIIKSYELPKEIGFVVRGHGGWDKKREEVPYAITVSIEVLGLNVPIYESIKVENEQQIEV